MPPLGEILRRFRFHGVPGAPRSAAVPAEGATRIEAELAPVFSALEEAQRRSSDIVAAAEADAARRRAEAGERSRRIVAEAQAAAGPARAEAVDERLARAAGEQEQLRADGRLEAERIERVAAERTPALVEAVVRRVLLLASVTADGEPAP